MNRRIIIPFTIALVIASLIYSCANQTPDTTQDTAEAPLNVYSEDPYTFGDNILNELKRRGNDLTYSNNNYEDKQESNFVRKNGIYVSIGADNRNNMFLVFGIPKTFTKEAYEKLKKDYVDILDAEHSKFKEEYSAINMNIQDAPGNETTKNGFLFYNVQEKKLYLDKTDGI